ncbi:MAG TPA: hypothetical protein VGW96_07800 [Candidatus Eremiobacteraceae bacterium]|nr:hypothetical protein [Candidatus Eremiobacteraceae bacterium]
MLQGTTDQKIKRVSIWFYIIAAFQFFAAYSLWSKSSAAAILPQVAQIAMVLATVDLAIGLLFVVLGYFAAKKEPWAFVAGLILYALRAGVEFFTFFSPIALLIRGFLLFRMYQGLQACLDAKQAQLLTRAQSMPRRLEMPHTPVSTAPPAAAWQPVRQMQSSEKQTL